MMRKVMKSFNRNLDESLVMVKSLLHLTSSLQKDDTTHAYKSLSKFIELIKIEKFSKLLSELFFHVHVVNPQRACAREL